MVRSDKPRQLIVEGTDDLFAVVGLMQSHCDWPRAKEEAPVWVEPAGGVDPILESGFLSAYLKMREIRSLGVVLDADEHASGRYQSIRDQCSQLFPNMPQSMPREGLIVTDEGGKRFGVWIMPDNASPGTLEVFLKYLVPAGFQSLWNHAEVAVDHARTLGATVKEADIPKAHMHTLLAWQDEPGQRFGVAITKSVLDPNSPHAQPFVAWFKNLYEL